MKASHQHIAFLCGHFTMSGKIPTQKLKEKEWIRQVLPEDKRNAAKRFFYPEFVDFCHASETDNTCIRFTKNIDKEINICIKEKKIVFAVKEITLYVMPFKTAMFSIRIEQETDNLNDCTNLLFYLRSIDKYSEEDDDCLNEIYSCMKELYEIMMEGKEIKNKYQLIENGNKLRIFQIVNSHDEEIASLPEKAKDQLLYELATVSEITKPNKTSLYSASDSYMKKIIEKNKISVFRNWSGLALMDTFTIHAYDASDNLINNWVDNYFHMIYIHCIFQKSYLFNLNIRFRRTLAQTIPFWKSKLQKINVSHTNIDQLVNEYESFEQKCCFHKISYNFLPLEIANSIDKGLEIKEEMTLLYKVMEREKTRKDVANDKMVNMLLFSLSLLTLFSAIWDISCLLDKMFPYSEYLGGQLLGYRTVALLILLAVCFLFFVIYKGHRLKK